MPHVAEIVETKVLSNGAIAFRARCCAQEDSDSWHTHHVTPNVKEADIHNAAQEHIQRVSDQHAAMELALKVASKYKK